MPFRAGRTSITLINTSTTVVAVGDASVTTSNGAQLQGTTSNNGYLTIPSAAALYGVVASSTQTISYIETF